jgi:hypothetical protein
MNFCSTILKLFQNLFFKLIHCSIILKSFQNVFFYPRTRVTLCRIHNTVQMMFITWHIYQPLLSYWVPTQCFLSHLVIQEFPLWLVPFSTFVILTKKTLWLNVLFNISIYLNRYQYFLFIY